MWFYVNWIYLSFSMDDLILCDHTNVPVNETRWLADSAVVSHLPFRVGIKCLGCSESVENLNDHHYFACSWARTFGNLVHQMHAFCWLWLVFCEEGLITVHAEKVGWLDWEITTWPFECGFALHTNFTQCWTRVHLLRFWLFWTNLPLMCLCVALYNNNREST
jgi:hypothetical protein